MAADTGRSEWFRSLISVDIESGFSERPEEAPALVAGLAPAGVVGVNIEEGRADGRLVPSGHQYEVISAVKERTRDLRERPARTRTGWPTGAAPGTGDGDGGGDGGGGGRDETLARADAHRRAGADGVFVPALQDPHTIAALGEASATTYR